MLDPLVHRDPGDETDVDLDRFIRQLPTPHSESVAAREAIERVNRETRARLRQKRGTVVFSTVD